MTDDEDTTTARPRFRNGARGGRGPDWLEEWIREVEAAIRANDERRAELVNEWPQLKAI